MINWKSLVLGIITGSAVTITATAIASEYPTTIVSIANDVLFKINDKLVGSPSDQPALIFNNRVYVPIRFVAEQIGCEVEWDLPNRKVVVNSPEQEVQIIEKEIIKEVPVYIDSSEDPDRVAYSKLPVTRNTQLYKIEVVGIDNRDESFGSDKSTKVFVNIKNKDENSRIQVVQNDCRLIVDGKKYKPYGVSNTWDKNWYNDLPYDNEHEGYLIFDQAPEGYEKCTLEIALRINGTTGTTNETVTFNFFAD